MTFYVQTPDHDFAPEPKHTSEALAKKQVEIFDEDPEVFEATNFWVTGMFSDLELLDRLKFLRNRALSRAIDAFLEGEGS